MGTTHPLWSLLSESGMDPGIAGSGTFILSGDTLFLDGLQFMRSGEWTKGALPTILSFVIIVGVGDKIQ